MSNILVVDDDRGMRRGIALALKQDKHEVTEAATGVEALDIIKQKYFNLIVSDLRLPGMNGLTLLEQIKEISPSTIVIMITSYGTLKTAVEAGKKGVYDFIDKNFSLEELKFKVTKALESQKIKKNGSNSETKKYSQDQLETKNLLKFNKKDCLDIINAIKEEEDRNKLTYLFGKLVNEISLKEDEINKLTIEMSNIYEELSLFYQISKSFSSLYDLDKIYKIAVSSSINQINTKRGMIGTVKENGNLINLKSAVGYDDNFLNNYIRNNSFFEKVISYKKPVIDNHIYKHRDKYFGLADKNSLIIPFRINTKERGILCLFDKIDDNFNVHDMKAAATIAYQCSISIEKATYCQEFQDLFLGSIHALSSAIDAKDEYTHGHSYRVAKYAIMIADKLNFSKEEKDKVYLAGLLHDIGKIGTPLEILHKPGALTSEEFDIIKEHPEKSACIIKSIKKLSDIIPAIMTHHEHFNGAGYPKGLKGKDIPLVGRILTIADAFDAMTSNRPYRKKMSLKEALYQVKCSSEKQFDPIIVDMFTHSYLEVEKLYNSFHNKLVNKFVNFEIP